MTQPELSAVVVWPSGKVSAACGRAAHVYIIAAIGEACAAMVQKDGMLVAHNRALVDVPVECGGGLPRQRHLAFLAAFAAHAEPAFRAVDIFEVETGELADSQPAAVQHLEDSAVACRMRAFLLHKTKDDVTDSPASRLARRADSD